MPTALMSQEEKLKVLASVKPIGDWQETEPVAFGSAAIEWEKKIPIDEWRENPGKRRKILPLLRGAKRNNSVAGSIQNRLRKLYPEESWVCTVRNDGIYLRFNGEKQRRGFVRSGQTANETNGNGNQAVDLFA